MSAAAERFFVDTNVLLYALDPVDPVKRERASRWEIALWGSRTGRISWQVINEFYSSAFYKLKATPTSVRAKVETYARWQPVGFDLSLVKRAWHWMDKAGVHYWDALILASAEATSCSYLLSEDFQAGQEFNDITVVNPFQHRHEEFGLF